MPNATKQLLACAWLAAAILGSAACSPKRAPPLTVADLMEDRARGRDADCLNARIAIERLAKDVDPAEEEKRKAAFEASREKLRLAQDKMRQEQEAKTKVDAYNLPLVPVDPAPAGDVAPGQPRP